MKNKPENVIMTEGDPKKIIFRFAQPLIFANLFQQLYNTMDTIIVGKINGDEALAAVGVSFAVTMVMIAVATGTGIETGMGYMTDLALCYIIMGINSSFNGMLRGLGCLKLFLSGSIINLTFRIIFTYALVSVIGVSAVWLSMPAGWVLSFIYGRVGYRIMCKKKDSSGISDI